MAQLIDNVGYLAKEIGARPAGTEEEQQAALYITEQFQKETGFTANIEEFTAATNPTASRAVLALVVIAATLLAIIFPVLNIPAFILAAAAAVVYVLEALDRPLLARFLSRGASQNVVAKYQPAFEAAQEGGGPRSINRKVVLIAHYDTDHVTPGIVERAQASGLPLPLICLVAMVAAAFFQFLRIFMAPGGGMGLLVLNVLSILAILVCALPAVKALLVRQSPYNEGANNNATGTAALVEVARRIARGSVSEADLAQDASDELRIHGEAAAREAGLVPEGVQIRYEAAQLVPPAALGDYDEEERLLSAKAAIAAMTGKPVERRVYGSVADKLVNSRVDDEAVEFVDPNEPHGSAAAGEGDPVAAGHAASSTADVSAAASASPAAEAADGFENAPSWFVAAQKNARKATGDSRPADVQRSKYTEAMENAERERAEREQEAREAEWAEREAEQRKREEEARAALEASAPATDPAHEGDTADSAAVAEEGVSTELAPTAEPAETAEPAAPGSTVAMSAPVPAAEIAAEAALLDDAPRTQAPARERITGLPSIDAGAAPAQPAPSAPAATSSPSKSGILRKLRTNIPSLSGLIDPITDEEVAANRREAIRSVPSIVNVPTPVDPAPEPVRVPAQAPATPASASEPASAQAADSAIAMEVPRSRSANLLKKMQRGDEALKETPQEWLNVDDDFDARTVGRERGSWESFRDDQYFDDGDVEEFGTGDDRRPRRRTWQGGAYSRKSLGHVDMRSGAGADADEMVPEELPADEVDRSLTGEIEQIYHFRNPLFNTEVWFVAIGSDTEGHDGARAFFEEHHDELRGSMVIEIESLGAGALSVASEEGRVRKLTASSRIKRYTRTAVAATGLALDEVSLAGSESIASTAQRAGFQAMHLFGAEDGRPALKGSADDVLENIDELALDDNVNFIYELLKR